jgi:tRNA pseudouridine32 synthase/23S rRNA pseudouridine746 synthase
MQPVPDASRHDANLLQLHPMKRGLGVADLPSRDGVGASCVALPGAGWSSIFAFLCDRFPMIPAQDWNARMTRGEVLDDGGNPLGLEAQFRPHAKIFYYRSLPAELPIPFEAPVLFRDDLLVAVDKPHFLPVTPGGAYLQQTLLVRLKRSLGIETLAPMHRLDRDTAGVMLFSIQPATRNAYHALFRERAVEKTYEAIAPWNAGIGFPRTVHSRLVESAAFMQMETVEGVPNAETRIEVMQVQGRLARYRLRPATGQKHQLRAHMAALGLPIVDDRIYPILQPPDLPGAVPDFSKPLQLLARSLAFTDPVTGRARSFVSKRAVDFPQAPGDASA